MMMMMMMMNECTLTWRKRYLSLTRSPRNTTQRNAQP